MKYIHAIARACAHLSGAVVLVGAIATSSAYAEGKGSQAPNCKLSLLDGKAQTSIAQLKGKVLYVDFWASWCVPCKASFPFMNKLDKELSGKGLQVLAINLDQKPEDAKKFLTQHPVRFAIAVKANESCAKEFGVEGMPSSFIVGRTGKIEVVHQGFRPADAAKLRGVIGKLLAEKGN